MKVYLSIIFLILLFSFKSFSANYYFSEKSGNDQWTGRLPSPNANNTDGPRKSLTALNSLLNSVVKPGDSVFLRRGDSWTGNTGIAIGSAQGTVDAYIFIGAYGTGNKPVINKSGTGEILLCRGSSNAASSYLRIKDLTLVSNSPIGSRPVGVYVNESFYNFKPHHIIFDRLTIRGCQNGMVLYQNNLTIENCLLEKNGNDAQGQGIFSSANDVVFKNNVLDSNGCGSVFVHSVYISQCSNVVFENNEIKNADDGLKLRSSTNLLIRNNRIHDTYIHSIHVGGDQSSGTKNVVIDGNVLYNVPQGLRISSESGTQTLLSENIIVKNNIFPAMVFITDNGPVKDVFIYNNIIHTASNQPALFFINAINPNNLQIKNNIFYKTNSNSNHSLLYFGSNSGLNGISLNNNLYYFPVSSNNLLTVGSSSYKNLTSFRSIYANQEINGQYGNPNFINAPSDFHLTASSVLAIDKGADLSAMVATDLEGMARPVDGDGNGTALWDIGPYEYCCVVSNKPDLIKQNQSYVFPNPTQDQISLVSINGIPDKITLMDLAGNVVMESIPNKQQTNLNVTILNSGVYIIRLYYNSRPAESIKFIKI